VRRQPVVSINGGVRGQILILDCCLFLADSVQDALFSKADGHLVVGEADNEEPAVLQLADRPASSDLS